MNPIPASSDRRTGRELSSSAFTAHTNADQAHQTSASATIASPSPPHVRWLRSSVVTCVIANTNTRSHSSSIGLTRRSSASIGTDLSLLRLYGHG